MKKTLFTIALATTAATSLSYGAALASFFDNFESNDPVAPLIGNGWKVFGNIFDPGGGYLYGYGPFDAPNGTPGFSSISVGEGGPQQGAQGLVVYSDYNSPEHGNLNIVEANVFQEQTIVPGEGGLYTFQFDAKAGDLVAPSTASAFIKVLDPLDGFSLSEFLTVDTTALPVEWGTYSIDIDVNGLGGQILQFGFLNQATDFDASGVQYDNVLFTPEPTSAMLLGLSGLVLLRRRRR